MLLGGLAWGCAVRVGVWVGVGELVGRDAGAPGGEWCAPRTVRAALGRRTPESWSGVENIARVGAGRKAVALGGLTGLGLMVTGGTPALRICDTW